MDLPIDHGQLLATLRAHGVTFALLFGSRAVGGARPDSDVDVLVVLRGPVDAGEEILRSGEVASSLSLQFHVVLSRVFISAEQFCTEQSPLLLNIRREGILL